MAEQAEQRACDGLLLEHICKWNLRASRNTFDYQYNYCRGCGRITNFHWKSFWRRLRCLFRNDNDTRFK